MANVLDILIKVREDGTRRSVGAVNSGLGQIIKQGAILSGTFIGVQTALQGLKNAVVGTFRAGIRAVDDYKVSVASLGAITLSFMEVNDQADLAENWQLAQQYAESMIPTIEELSAQTLLSGEQAKLLATEFTKAGQIIDASNERQVQGLKNISNGLFTLTGGLNLERQIITEIGHLMQGQITAQDLLGKLLLKIDPNLKENLKSWLAQGTAIENIGRLLQGFEPATKDLATSWNAVKSTLETINKQILRDGMKPLYQNIIRLMLAMKDSLIANKEVLITGLLKTWESIKTTIKAAWLVLKPFAPLLMAVWEVLKVILDGLGLFLSFIEPILERLGYVVDAVWGWAKAMWNVFQAVYSLLSLDFKGAVARIKEAAAEIGKAGEASAKAFGGNILREMEQNAIQYQRLGKDTGEIVGENIVEEIKARLREAAPSDADEKEFRESFFSFLEGESDKAKAQFETADALLKSFYERGKVSLQQYFDGRRVILEGAYETEVALLKQRLSQTTDKKQEQEIQTKLSVLEQRYKKDLIKLTDEQVSAERKLAQARLDAEKILQGLAGRTAEGLLARHRAELAELDAKHQEEITRLRDLKATEAEINEAYRLQELEKERLLAAQKVQIQQDLLEKKKLLADLGVRSSDDMQDQFVLELAEIDARHQAEIQKLRDLNATKEELNEAHRLQELEKDKLLHDQQQRLVHQRLEQASTIAGGMAEIFGAMYEATGRKSRTFFRLQQALSIAQATINIAEAITKAMAQGGIFGIATGTIIAAMGGIQIAKIAAQSFATGGIVKGGSGTKDDVPIMAMGGEFVLPTASVRYYGSQVMEALRRRLVPRDFFAGLSSFGLSIQRPAFAFAGGGEVVPRGNARNAGQEVNITNVVDPNLFDQHMASAQGQRSLVNVISANRFQLRKIIMD